MSFDELLHENQLLKAQLADRDVLVAQLAADLKLLKEQISRWLAGRGQGPLIAEGQEVLFPDEPASEGEGDETPEHGDEAPDGEDAADRIKRRHRPAKPARKIDTSALRRVEVTHELSEQERICPESGLLLVPVGEKVFDEVDYQRPEVFVVRHTQILYGLSAEDAEERQASQQVAPLPARPLEGCAASASLLSCILVQKYSSHLPLYRQQEIFARQGLRLPRQTMCDWVLGAAQVLEPIADCQMAAIRDGPVTQLDDTPVMCQGGKGKKHFQSYLWTYVNPQVEGVAYRFTPGRSSDLIAQDLHGVEGYVVGDGYSGNKAAARKVPGEIILSGCWAHATRKFRDALVEAPGTAQLFRDEIKRLYAVEAEANDAQLDPEGRQQLRAQKSRTILASLLSLGRRLKDDYSDAGKMAQAISYMLNQRKPLRRFLENGLVPLDNNRCERSIRPIAVGRKNWLFAGSLRGGRAAATIYTLIECCRLAEVDPERYLADVLLRVASHPASRIEELLPSRWKQLLEQEQADIAPVAATV